MTPHVCSREEEVIRQLGSASGLSADLTQHVAHCEACAETARVAACLTGLLLEEAPLQSPEIILWRARLAERERLLARSTIAINVLNKLGLVCGLVIAAFVFCALHMSSAVIWQLVGAIVTALAAVVYVARPASLIRPFRPSDSSPQR